MNPTPWKAVRHNPVNVTVDDANGVALATAHQLPPYCDSMETATRIVEAVNGIEEISLEAARLRFELNAEKEIAVETGKQKLDALFEAARLRDIVRRLLPYARERLATVNARDCAMIRDAEAALAEEAQA